MPLISVITPASRGVDHLSHLLRDFKNQTFKSFEHIIVYDGEVPADVQNLMESHKSDYNFKFTSIKKDLGNMSVSPGTNPRNHGISLAQGDFVIFCDDDDRYRDVYLETLINNMQDNMITVTQMTCSEARMYRNGSPHRTKLVPEVGLPTFPVICHVGTPCAMLPRKWAVEEPWRHEPEHDFRFLKRIVERFHPLISFRAGMNVDVDSLVIGTLKDWVTVPPFFRG